MHGRQVLAGVAWCLLSIGEPRAIAAEPAQPAARIWEEPVSIPTYRVGEPEKNPMFFRGRSYQGAKGPIYPYPLLDKLSDDKEDKTWRAVFLENEYVQYSILPELGGRIFAGLDKTNDYDFVYRQHVIKPALIGMVGAWISGGIEWNIPHHHRASTFMPVDCRTVENADGSRTVWLGEIELRHRMKWLVGLTLFPDRSYLKVTVKLFNRTPLPHSMLYFANIAVHANPDYQVLFPPGTEYGTQHGKSEFVSWPVGGGRYGGFDRTGVDVSWWKNLPTPVSIFAWNYEDDFVGGYDHGRQAGIAVVADHHVAPGKKFFEWGNGPDGRMWDKILTDTDGPYLELMAGGYSDNQPDYSWVQPGDVKVVEQYYYPLRKLGGLKNANTDAAVNLEVNGSKARLAFNTTARHANARALLKARDKVVLEKIAAISPAEPFVVETTLAVGVRPEDLSASLVTADGRELISYQPAPRKGSPTPPKVEPPPPPNEVKSVDELYLAGLRLEQFHSPAREPYPYYEEALNRDPGDYRANVALGILYCNRGLFEKAGEHLRAAVKRATHNYTNPKDCEAFYYLGVALRAMGKDAEAIDVLERACWSPAWRGPASQVLAAMACRRSDLRRALSHARNAVGMNSSNTRAMNLQCAILRRMGSWPDALAVAARIRETDPLDYGAGNERYLIHKAMGAEKDASTALEDLQGLMRGDVNATLELAADYADAGFLDEAIDVLTRQVNRAADPNRVSPMVYYWLGHMCAQKGDEAGARTHETRAARAPVDLCFPFQLEFANILSDALRRNPSDARAAYLLGNLLYDLQPQAAIEAWERSRAADPNFATVHRNLGFACAHFAHTYDKAAESQLKAVACDPGDPRLLAELDVMNEFANVAPEKRLAVLESHHATVLKRDDVLLREAALNVVLGRYDRALELMDNRHFRLWEGETGVHDVYADAHLLRGRQHLKAGRHEEARKNFLAAQEYPDRFEEARPDNGDGRLIESNYCLGLLHEAVEQPDQARSCFELAVKGRCGQSDLRYYQALAHRKLGNEGKAAELLDGLVAHGRERVTVDSDMDFFAKFGTRESVTAAKARAHYLLGLGLLGQGKAAEAVENFRAAVKLNAAHLGARTLLAELAEGK